MAQFFDSAMAGAAAKKKPGGYRAEGIIETGVSTGSKETTIAIWKTALINAWQWCGPQPTWQLR